MYYLHRAGETTGPYVTAHLVRMVEAGEIGADALVCETGAEEWFPMGEVISVEPAPALRLKRRNGGLVFLSVILFVIGLSCIVGGIFTLGCFGFVLGLLLIVVSVLIDSPKWLCGACGNRIEETSQLCPACHASLVDRLPRRR